MAAPRRASFYDRHLARPGLLLAMLTAALVAVFLFMGFELWTVPSGPVEIAGRGFSLTSAVHLEAGTHTLQWSAAACPARQALSVDLVPGQSEGLAAATNPDLHVIVDKSRIRSGETEVAVATAGYYKFLVWDCGTWRLSLSQ